MKKLAVFAVSAVAAAASLTEADKQEGLAQLDRTRAGVVEATKGLSEAQWKFKSAPDRWSVAEILEHIVVVEQSLLENTYQKVMQAPAGKPDRDYNSVDKLVLSAIADRTQRAQAPEPVVPKGRWQPPETLDRFLKIRAQTAEFLKSTPGLRDHVADSPIGQPLDAYQWLLFISAHSDRHTKQILEVKADTNFPKN
jgi:DinB family protein